MVTEAEKWPWSSYRATIGISQCQEWLETDWILSAFGGSRGEARARFIDFVRSGVGLESIWDDLTGQIYLGSKAFVKRVQATQSDTSGILEVSRAARPLTDYRDNYPDRREGMAAAYATGDYSMKEIGVCFDVHYSTVSCAIKHFERQVVGCKTCPL